MFERISDEKIAASVCNELHPMPKDIAHVCQIVTQTQLEKTKEELIQIIRDVLNDASFLHSAKIELLMKSLEGK